MFSFLVGQKRPGPPGLEPSRTGSGAFCSDSERNLGEELIKGDQVHHGSMSISVYGCMSMIEEGSDSIIIIKSSYGTWSSGARHLKIVRIHCASND